ncbi:hypothetical protein LTR53_001191 [Teratosphaeriaceae sp. CCFEE 6253]|nr:hypothetical protein LTR53_001191 [Teratosphaeriaceae sp. CCFEE 6253]
MANPWPPATGLSTPSVPRPDVVLPLHASTLIHAPADRVFAAVLRVADYNLWNTFCPRVDSPSATLSNGDSFTFHVIMNSSKPGSLTATGLKVTDVSTPEQISGYIPRETLSGDGSFTADLGKVYRVAWASEGGFVSRGLRSERFHEVIVSGKNECEVRTWECMGGPLAYTVKWLYKQTLLDKFQLWCEDLKKYCEQ